MENKDYESLLDDETIVALKERREAIGGAINDLMNQMEQVQAARRELDKKDEELYAILKQLDAAYARLSRGQKYTSKAKKRVVRRFWTDETHEWVERFVYEWARKQLLDGPKSVGEFNTSDALRLSLVDAITVMKHHPDVFEERKGPKPTRKHARASMEWVLKDSPARFSRAGYSAYWWMEATMIIAAGRERPKTLSEQMHVMLEEAIKLFYAGGFTTVAHAFNDLFWKDFAGSFHYYRTRVQELEAQVTALKKLQEGASGEGRPSEASNPSPAS
jgi:hypothetical protein